MVTDMFCISISFKKTPLGIRQQFSFTQEEQTLFLSGLLEAKHITGGVVLSTCNRSEIYFTSNDCGTGEVENKLSVFKHIDIENIKKYGLYYQGKKTVKHLYKVACGLDSMVLGEDEILRQVKEAYLSAKSQGFTNSVLNIVFQGAFNCAKLSKSETKLSNTPVSIGTLTANAVEEYVKQASGKTSEQRGEAHQKKVLVIGATGRIGSIVGKDLIAKGISVIGTSRRRQYLEGSYLQDNEKIEWLEFERRYEVLSDVAAVVSATSSPHYTLTREEFLRHAGKTGYLLVDLAVPYDIDKKLNEEGSITLLDIDYFQTLSKENSNLKLGEVDKVQSILEESVDEVLKKLYIRDFQEKMADMYEQNWFRKMTVYLKDVLDSEQLLKVLLKICDKENQNTEGR